MPCRVGGKVVDEEKDPSGLDQHIPGAKLDGDKPDMSLLVDMGRALMSVAEVGTFGAKKYTRGGWKHVPQGADRYTAALLRHLMKSGEEEFDEDSGLPHLAHMAWNALAILEFYYEANKPGRTEEDSEGTEQGKSGNYGTSLEFPAGPITEHMLKEYERAEAERTVSRVPTKDDTIGERSCCTSGSCSSGQTGC